MSHEPDKSNPDPPGQPYEHLDSPDAPPLALNGLGEKSRAYWEFHRPKAYKRLVEQGMVNEHFRQVQNFAGGILVRGQQAGEEYLTLMDSVVGEILYPPSELEAEFRSDLEPGGDPINLYGSVEEEPEGSDELNLDRILRERGLLDDQGNLVNKKQSPQAAARQEPRPPLSPRL